MSNESPEKGLPCTKIRVGDWEGPSRAICVFHVVGVFVSFLSFCLVFLPVRSLPSVFSHGRTQFHTSKIVPLRALKNGDRWVFSYGRVGTTVRTRRYDGSRSSVRSQLQVLLSVETGAADAFFALETVYLCEYMFILMRSDGRILKYLTHVFLIGTILRKCALAENGKSGNCDVKTRRIVSF